MLLTWTLVELNCVRFQTTMIDMGNMMINCSNSLDINRLQIGIFSDSAWPK